MFTGVMTIEIFGCEIRFIVVNNVKYFVCSDISPVIGVSMAVITSMHKKGDIRISKKRLQGKNLKLINLKSVLILLSKSNDLYAKDLNKWLLSVVLPTLAIEGDFTIDKDHHNPMLEIIKNIDDEYKRRKKAHENGLQAYKRS